MSLTQRQGTGLLVLWVVVSVGLTVLGPFGTFDLLGTLARLAYWSGVTGVSIALWVAQDRALHQWSPAPSALERGLSAFGYALCLGAVLSLVHLALFPDWSFGRGFAWLCGIILVVQAVIHGLSAALHLLSPPAPTPPQPDPLPNFLARLPLEKRGSLIRLEAEDHYIRAITTKGSDLLLLRLSDAEKELGETGWRVHRSHWVARGAVTGRRTANGQVLLVTTDSAEIPVGRSYRPALKAAGLL